MQILRVKNVLAKTGDTRSPLYDKVTKGLFTRPVKLGGGRASGWPEHEVGQIIVARIRGDSDAEIRALVALMHEQRKTLAINSVGHVNPACQPHHGATSPTPIAKAALTNATKGSEAAQAKRAAPKTIGQ